MYVYQCVLRVIIYDIALSPYCKFISVIFTRLDKLRKNVDSENLTNEPKKGDLPVSLFTFEYM